MAQTSPEISEQQPIKEEYSGLLFSKTFFFKQIHFLLARALPALMITFLRLEIISKMTLEPSPVLLPRILISIVLNLSSVTCHFNTHFINTSSWVIGLMLSTSERSFEMSCRKVLYSSPSVCSYTMPLLQAVAITKTPLPSKFRASSEPPQRPGTAPNVASVTVHQTWPFSISHPYQTKFCEGNLGFLSCPLLTRQLPSEQRLE